MPTIQNSVLDKEYLTIRAMSVSLAASLDRIERAGESQDERTKSICDALDIILKTTSGKRAEAVLNSYSD